MDWDRFWENRFWERVKKVAALGGIVSGLVAIPWFIYTVWRDRSAAQSPQAQGGSFVNLWTPTYVIGGCLILAAVIHLLAAFMSRRSLKQRLNKAESALGAATRKNQTCEENYSQLEKEKMALFGELAGVNELQEQYDDLNNNTKYIRGVALAQARSIENLVYVMKSEYGGHELMRNDPYLDFLFLVKNNSIYDIDLNPHLTGSISFGGRELTESVRWDRRLPISQNSPNWFRIRQELVEEDVIHILNGTPTDSFNFSGLDIQINGGSGFEDIVVPHSLSLHDPDLPSMSNEELLKKYPKLDIKITNAVYDWLITLGTKARSAVRNPCYITLLLDVTNRRTPTIEVATYKMIVSVKGKDYIAFADSGEQVHPHRYITDEGFEAVGHQAFPNLNHATPLVCHQDKSISGALQFLVSGIQFADFIAEPDSLNDAQFTLVLIDKNGEHHPQEGVLTHRSKVASLFYGG